MGEKDNKEKGKFKDMLIRKLKGPAPDDGSAGDPDTGSQDTGDGEISANGSGPSSEKFFSLLEEIRHIRELQKELNDKNQKNEEELAKLKKSIEEYTSRPPEIKEVVKEVQKDGPGDKKEGPAKELGPNLEGFKKQLMSKTETDQKIAELERLLKIEKKHIEDAKYEFEKRLLEAASKNMPDHEQRAMMETLKRNIKERDEVIHNLLNNRKIIPEHDRLMIVWLNNSLAEERQKNAKLQRRLKELEYILAKRGK